MGHSAATQALHWKSCRYSLQHSSHTLQPTECLQTRELLVMAAHLLSKQRSH
jgi:hypothetical protein